MGYLRIILTSKQLFHILRVNDLGPRLDKVEIWLEIVDDYFNHIQEAFKLIQAQIGVPLALILAELSMPNFLVWVDVALYIRDIGDDWP